MDVEPFGLVSGLSDSAPSRPPDGVARSPPVVVDELRVVLPDGDVPEAPVVGVAVGEADAGDDGVVRVPVAEVPECPPDVLPDGGAPCVPARVPDVDDEAVDPVADVGVVAVDPGAVFPRGALPADVAPRCETFPVPPVADPDPVAAEDAPDEDVVVAVRPGVAGPPAVVPVAPDVRDGASHGSVLASGPDGPRALRSEKSPASTISRRRSCSARLTRSDGGPRRSRRGGCVCCDGPKSSQPTPIAVNATASGFSLTTLASVWPCEPLLSRM